jgi:hypothetical protein
MQTVRIVMIAAMLSMAVSFVTTRALRAGIVQGAQAGEDDDEVWTDEDDGVRDEPAVPWAPEDENADEWTDEPELPNDAVVLLMASAEGASGDASSVWSACGVS